MNFKKKDFFIHKVDDTIEQTKGGWIDTSGNYGFHKILRKSGTVYFWVATDIATGLRICKAATRTACAKWIETNQDLIAHQKSKPEYKGYVEWLQNAVS